VYRVAHHGPGTVNPDGFGGEPRAIVVEADTAEVLADGDLTITAFTVQHSPIEPAFGYRIDYKDRSVVISGDTVYHPGLVAAAQGTDLLLHDAMNKEMVEILREANAAAGVAHIAKIMSDIQDYHASAVDAAQAAQDAGARALVFTHITPVLPTRLLNPLFLQGTGAVYDGPMTIGEDGLLFSLPAGSDAIEQESAFRF